jgi:hypothetical protein
MRIKLDFLSNTGDNRRFSITGWGASEISVLESAIAAGRLPYSMRFQDFSGPGKRLAGRCYYFYMGSTPGQLDSLERAEKWFNSRVLKTETLSSVTSTEKQSEV